MFSTCCIFFTLEPETSLINPVLTSATPFRSAILALALQILYIYYFICKFAMKIRLTIQSFHLSIRPSSHSPSVTPESTLTGLTHLTKSYVTVTSLSARTSFVLSSKHAPTQQHFDLPCLHVQFSVNSDWYETGR